MKRQEVVMNECKWCGEPLDLDAQDTLYCSDRCFRAATAKSEVDYPEAGCYRTADSDTDPEEGAP